VTNSSSSGTKSSATTYSIHSILTDRQMDNTMPIPQPLLNTVS